MSIVAMRSEMYSSFHHPHHIRDPKHQQDEEKSHTCEELLSVFRLQSGSRETEASQCHSVSLAQLERLHLILRDHLKGLSLEESLAAAEDLNKRSDEELNRRKAQMDQLFERNRKHKEDPDFVYDLVSREQRARDVQLG